MSSSEFPKSRRASPWRGRLDSWARALSSAVVLSSMRTKCWSFGRACGGGDERSVLSLVDAPPCRVLEGSAVPLRRTSSRSRGWRGSVDRHHFAPLDAAGGENADVISRPHAHRGERARRLHRSSARGTSPGAFVDQGNPIGDAIHRGSKDLRSSAASAFVRAGHEQAPDSRPPRSRGDCRAHPRTHVPKPTS